MGPFDIAIIGAGQIGSRHLQAMAQFSHPARIHLVDPSPAAMATAIARLDEAKGHISHKDVRIYEAIGGLPTHLDLVIVATGANVRRAVVEDLLAKASVRHLILEKFLFQQVDDFEAVQRVLESHAVKAWVNCPRRTVGFYQDLKRRLAGAEQVALAIAGSQVGIGCNAIHYLDLMAFLSGDVDFQLSTSGLDASVYPSKRPGFVEFCGHLDGVSKAGHRFSLSSFATGGAPTTLHLATDSLVCLIREQEGRAWCAEAMDGWQWEERAVSMPLQSQLTHLVVTEILETGSSRLTAYEESSKLHLSILNALISHMDGILPGGRGVCPIT